MKTIILTIFIIICKVCYGEESKNPSKDKFANLTENFRNETNNFFTPLYKALAQKSNVNFVFAPRSVYLMLAAIAEGSNEETKKQLFKILHLSDEPYYRYKFYELMTSRVRPTNGVSLVESRTLLMDEMLDINPAWLNLITVSSLLEAVTVPMHSNPEYTENWIKRFTTTNQPKIDLNGNSVLLDTVDYNGVWATAFDDAVIEISPFYNQEGEEIGSVELMRMKRRAKTGYVKSLNAKTLELPVGDGQYRMLFLLPLDKKDIKSIVTNLKTDTIYEMLASFNETEDPIDIAIPRIKITSEIDMTEVLKDFELNNLWTDSEVTKFISTPPAFPKSYVQRATVTFDKYGIAPVAEEEISSVEVHASKDPEIVSDFILDHPFMSGLFDAETYTLIIAMGISQPTVHKFGTTYTSNL